MLHSEGIPPSVSLCTAFVSRVQDKTLLSSNVLLSCAAGCALCWAQDLCVASGTLVWEDVQGTALVRGAGAGCPLPSASPSISMPPAGQALLLLLHPLQCTVMHFCEPAKAPQ